MLLSCLDGVGEGGRRGPGLHLPGREGLYVGTSAVYEHQSNIIAEVDRRCVKHNMSPISKSQCFVQKTGMVVKQKQVSCKKQSPAVSKYEVPEYLFKNQTEISCKDTILPVIDFYEFESSFVIFGDISHSCFYCSLTLLDAHATPRSAKGYSSLLLFFSLATPG